MILKRAISPVDLSKGRISRNNSKGFRPLQSMDNGLTNQNGVFKRKSDFTGSIISSGSN
jgi:hypothetical protein